MCRSTLYRVAFVLGVFSVFVVGMVRSANADVVCLLQGESRTFNYVSSFGSAGSATATFTLSGNTLIVNYQNTSTSNTFLSGIALNTTPNLQGSLLSSAATNNWTAGVGPGGGLGSFGLVAYGNGKTRLTAGNSGTAVFVLSYVPDQLCIDSTIIHLTSLPNGDSEKPIGEAVPSGGGGGA